VTTTDNDVDYVSAPANYADFFKIYYEYTVNFVAKLGIDDNNKYDVASEICMRFLERHSLEKFDADLNFYYNDEMRPARFRSYYSRSIEMYARGMRDKQKKLARRELQICDIHHTEAERRGSNTIDVRGGGKSSQASWVEIWGEAHQDHSDGVLDAMTEEAEAEGIRRALATVPARSAHDRCDLVAVYDAVRVQILTYGEYDINRLREHFGVSSTAMHSWIWWLKENLASIYGLPVPAKRPRRTRRERPAQ
jgi:hypothetical protein